MPTQNYTKLVEVVTVADVDDENRVGNSLLQIWKLRFGHKGTGKSIMQNLDANSKLVDVVTVADDDHVGRFGN